jgi:modulator of FtsH protease
VSAYDAGQWSDFAVAVVGAAAALTGLLFVAVSISIERILSFPRLPGRAAMTLTTLAVMLLVGIFLLAPGQGDTWLGVEIAVTGGALGALASRSSFRIKRQPDESLVWVLSWLTRMLVPAALFLVGGISLATGAGGGLYWVLAGIVVGFAVSVLNLWILLIEIYR